MQQFNSTAVGQSDGGVIPHPDSAVAMDFGDVMTGIDAAHHSAKNVTVTLDYDGVSVVYTFDELAKMNAKLVKARADGLFPTTEAGLDDIRATVDDYFRLVSLGHLRDAYDPEEWNHQPTVVDLLVRITRDIRARDKLAAEKTEEERVQAHVKNMMSGVGAEAKLYNIVQHAIAYAAKNGSSEQAATLTGKSMAELLNGIRGVVMEMAGQGTHNISGVNLEAVVEDVFKTIDFALGNLTDPINDLGGHVKHMDGQIMHLDAIGHHVNAIDGHVHSLGNNLNSMGTLLNSTNGNVVSLTTQIALLQTIVNMLPRMVDETLEQMVPQILATALGPIIQALEAQLGIASHSFGKKKSIIKKISAAFKKVFKKSS
ncbi:hypothetical protein GGR53DRAFT_324383 [Hypoxylon sp. FL1150]|nr:hypothetical protein GGR53DRAFT_324383 [Hypoxylon sp. FL1150]